MATIEIKQVFVNNSSLPVEATYSFPADPKAVLGGLHFQVGDRCVEGKVLRKDRAHERYEDAVTGGHSAMLATQSEENRIAMKLGGILAGQEVTVTVTLLKMLGVENGAYCLKVPAACILRGSEDGSSALDIQYSLRVEINTQHKVTYLSVPTHSHVSKLVKAQP